MKVIAGPCQHESLSSSLIIASHCKKICDKYNIDYIFKASFDKANRTYGYSERGLGINKCKEDFDVLRGDFKVTTDFHETQQIKDLEVDVIQIPAFLSKQTDLLLSAKNTGKIVNVKKGQFVPPEQVDGILSKIGNKDVWITERGHVFGYNRTVIDFEGIKYMQNNYDVPIFLDITHSISERMYALTMAKLAGTMGVDLFVEVHIDPNIAPSDGKKSIFLKDFENLIKCYYDCRKGVGQN